MSENEQTVTTNTNSTTEHGFGAELRELVKPLFMAMRRHGMQEITLRRDGEWSVRTLVTLEPDEPDDLLDDDLIDDDDDFDDDDPGDGPLEYLERTALQ